MAKTGKNGKNGRKNGRKGKTSNQVATASRGTAYPPQKTVLFNYSDVGLITEASAGAGVFAIYRAGDVYDPDYSGVGHQPMYFDQLCSSTGPYLAHTTHSITAQIRVNNISGVSVLVVLFPSMVVTSPASRNQAVEKPYAIKRLMPPVGTAGAMWDFTFKLNNPRFCGLTVPTYEAFNSGSFGASASCPYLHLCVYGVGNVASVTYEVNLIYNTKLYQLGNTATS